MTFGFNNSANAAEAADVPQVFSHKADQSFYTDNALDNETPGYVLESDLYKDPDAEENFPWGSLYLHYEEVEPGFYDFAEKRGLGAVYHLDLNEVSRPVLSIGPDAHLAGAGAAAEV